MTIETYVLTDDGTFPNSRLPVLIYRNVMPADVSDRASWLETTFEANNWLGTWRNGIFPYDHYHSTTHEVLGIYSGSATLRLGGPNGLTLPVSAGDVLVIPAGVAHNNRGQQDPFGVVGAYPDGRPWDLLRGRPGERPFADQTIAGVPLPATDPLTGPGGTLTAYWLA